MKLNIYWMTEMLLGYDN